MTFNFRPLAVALVVLAAAVPALDVARAQFSPDQRGEIEKIVRDYLLRNPEILQEVIQEMERRQTQAEAEKFRGAIKEHADALFNSKRQIVLGNPQGDVTMVEFFDYNCGYCRRALTDVVKLTNDDGKVRLVLKELPIFGEDSEAAAKIALAADKQGKYFEMHQKLFTESGKADKEKGLRIAKELNLDVEKLQKDAESDDIKKALEEAKDLAQKLNLQGTPLFLIGDRVVPGAPDDLYDQLKAKVVEVREKGCASTC